MKGTKIQSVNDIRINRLIPIIGLMSAMSIILVYLIHFPIMPATPFLEYDPADIPILIGAFAYGPLVGLILTVTTSLVQGLTVSSASGFYGILMHIIATGTFVVVSSYIYSKNKTKKSAFIGLFLGSLAMAAVMVPANYVITPLFLKVPTSMITDIVAYIVAFNLIKAFLNSVFIFFLYKRISNFIYNRNKD